MSYFTEHNSGIFGSGIVHLIVFVLLILMGFIPQNAPEEEEGILVNFGTSENGLGDIEPAPSQNPTALTIEKETAIAPVKTIPPKPKPKAKVQEDEDILTQDYEKTIALKAAEKKRKDESDRVKRENAEKQRLRQEELENQRQAELERQKQIAENQKIAEINSRTRGAFDRSGTVNVGTGNGPGGAGTGTNPNQGVTFPGGNQGVPTGDPNATTYGPGGRGSGKQGTGTGVSYNLSGRSAGSLPKPNYPGNEDGIVVVEVTVDKYGKVTKVIPGVRGSNTMNQALIEAARKAALEAKFNVDNNAPAFQTGTITYKFSLE
jgi:colicin import membrane protein